MLGEAGTSDDVKITWYHLLGSQKVIQKMQEMLLQNFFFILKGKEGLKLTQSEAEFKHKKLARTSILTIYELIEKDLQEIKCFKQNV